MFAGTLLAVLGWALPAAALAQRPFEAAEEWAARFDGPGRDAWQKPDEMLRALALPPDAIVADIGAGTGYFSTRFARALPGGVVYAADIEPEMVRYLEDRARREKLPNLVAIQAARDDPRLPQIVDLVLMVNVYHAIRDRTSYFRLLQKSLKAGARVAIISSRTDAPMGPPVEWRLTPDTLNAEMAAAGYALTETHDFLPYHHFLVFRVSR